jgi:methyl-accepting chemotaxis protein
MTLRFGSKIIKLLLIAGMATAATGLILSAGNLSTAPTLPAILVTGLLFSNLGILGGIYWIYSKRNLLQRVNRLAGALERGADGDLSIRVPASEDDEIGQLGRNLNTMLGKLSEFVDRVNGALSELRAISHRTTDAAEQLVGASETQSKAVKETSSAISDIGVSIDALSCEIDILAQSATQNAGSIRTMSGSLDVVGQNVEAQGHSIDEVSSSILEVAAAVKQIAGNVNSLMAAATATSTSVAEMDISIKQVEQNAQGAAAVTEAVRSDALTGQEAVAATISGIGEIKASSQLTFDSIDSLSKRVKAIGTIISVINEVAEQTNLLALNSAIIAAQAGEHGKGFAVVADQIKRLAMRTRNSTEEIADLITAIQKETGQAVTAINATEQRIADGERLSQRSGEALQKIVNGMEVALQQVHDIAKNTIAQAKGSQQIRNSMELISDMVAQIAGSTREQGMTSELIIAAVERMKSLTVSVRSSSDDQRKIGLSIADSTGKMSGIIGEVERLKSDQARRSQQIRHSMQEMDRATNEDLAAVRILEDGVENLSRQITLIQTEMAKLKIHQ